MKHFVMVKWNDKVTDRKAMEEEVLKLFTEAVNENEELHSVELVRNAVDLPNRYHSLFIVELEKENIPVWNECRQHLIWKNDYPVFVESKAIFDWE